LVLRERILFTKDILEKCPIGDDHLRVIAKLTMCELLQKCFMLSRLIWMRFEATIDTNFYTPPHVCWDKRIPRIFAARFV